jgi:pyrroloquinoline quinone (PQQ) biosynthesis protein C
VHGQAVKLARQANGEVADVDHLLHLADAFGANLAHLQRDQFAQRLLVRAQEVAQVAHDFAALGRGHKM